MQGESRRETVGGPHHYVGVEGEARPCGVWEGLLVSQGEEVFRCLITSIPGCWVKSQWGKETHRDRECTWVQGLGDMLPGADAWGGGAGWSVHCGEGTQSGQGLRLHKCSLAPPRGRRKLSSAH